MPPNLDLLVCRLSSPQALDSLLEPKQAVDSILAFSHEGRASRLQAKPPHQLKRPSPQKAGLELVRKKGH
jgi:hypothetical protein